MSRASARLALHVRGEHPTREIDHINNERGDNRIANLRDCSRTENGRNDWTHGASGFKGVSRHGSGWRARIQVNDKYLNLGTFASPEAAAQAYDEAAKRYYGEFAKTNADMAALRSAGGGESAPGMLSREHASQSRANTEESER